MDQDTRGADNMENDTSNPLPADIDETAPLNSTPPARAPDGYIPPEEANELPLVDAEPARRWFEAPGAAVRSPILCAVAYYRHSAQDRQKNSIQIQAEQVREYAREQGLRLIHEFADRGRSGLTAEGRPAFMEMMRWVRERNDFGHVLVLDISRWGRFQDIDLSGQYELDCRKAGKRVRYVNLGVPDDGPAGPILKALHRFTSAEESRTRSDKVFKGSVKVAEQGYRPGGAAPYGFARALITEQGVVDRILPHGQKKAIANWRIKLSPGDESQVAVIQEIFARFVDEGLDERQIAGVLSARGTLSPGGASWSPGMVGKILRDRQYAGAGVYNRTSQKLKTPTVRNPPEEWVISPGAHACLVPEELFERAQERFAERQRRRDPAEMLARLRALYEQYGIITGALINHDATSPSAASYASRFGSLPLAFQRLFAKTVERTAREVRERIDAEVAASDAYDDFLVLDRKLTVLIQPSVPVPNGYGQYWVFRPDRRAAVDITLGVPLAGEGDGRILGFFPFPRLMMRNAGIRLNLASVGVMALHGQCGLEMLRDILA